MKVIEFGPTWFRLPDDFVGGVSAALRALADYYDSKPAQTESQKPKRGRPAKVATEYDRFRVARIEQFLAAVKEGARLDGLIALSEGDGTSMTDVDIDKGWDK